MKQFSIEKKNFFLHEFFQQSSFNYFFSDLLSLLLSVVYKSNEVIQVLKIKNIFFMERDAPTKTFVLLSILFYLFHFVSCTLFLIFTLSDFCIPIKHGFLNVFPFEVDMNCFYLNTLYSVLPILYF